MTRLLCLLLLCPAVCGLFEWMRQKEAPPPPPPAGGGEGGGSALLSKDVGFEMATADEKFLAEAKELELSPLDSCHHRVVSRLKSSCDGLSEEQLAKFAVALFNCQSEAEGRATFTCTEDMSIKQCTAHMDSDTWNAYHIVSNRARSVCYVARQQLFRRRAEHTVNTLISTATSQLDAMKDLKEGQQELRDLTSSSLQKLTEGHSALQAQQEALQQGQGLMETSITENLQRLSQEKALIASGQELVARLIQGITQRVENVSEHLQVHGSEVQRSHNDIVKDLTDVRHQAQDIYEKIDHSMAELVQYQDQTSHYYQDLMEKLERMNSSLSFMLLFLDNMQERVEGKLHLIHRYLGWAGLSLSALWVVVSHTAYFLLCAVLLSFLRCPGFCRVLLLLTVPLNAAAHVQQQPALELSSLSLLLVALSAAHWCVSQMFTWFFRSRPPPPPPRLGPCLIVKQDLVSSGPFPPSSTPERQGTDILLETDDSFISGHLSVVSPPLRKPEPRFVPATRTPDHSTPRLLPRPLLSATPVYEIPLRNLGGVFDAVNNSRDFENDSRSASPTPSVISNSSMSGRQLCSGVTKTGRVCKKRAVIGQEFCRVHEGGQTSSVHS